MAQPVYSEHPLEAYLRRQRLPSLAHGIRTHTALKCLAGSGEGVEPMPGSAADFEPEEVEDEEDDAALPDSGWLPPAVQQIFEVLQTSLSSRKTVNQRRELAERFKYDVISSSLLTTSLATPLPHSRRPASPDIPGRLRSHSRNPSLAQSHPWHPPPKPQVTLPDMGFSNEQTQHWALVFTCAASFAAALRFYLLSALLLAIASYPYVADHPPAKSDSMLAAFDELRELIATGNLWESSVHEAIGVLEHEERSIYYSATSPSSPTAALRVALSTSLHTARAQCEKVRALFAALTCPAELSQLSEMYAPPSPGYTAGLGIAHLPGPHDFPAPRPLADPSSRRKRTISTPTRPSDKRATWNGTYSGLASAGSPTMIALRRREQRRSDMSALLNAGGSSPPWLSSSSAPVSPQPGKHLAGVTEEATVPEAPHEQDDNLFTSGSNAAYFGAQAMELRRKRRQSGVDSLTGSPTRRLGQLPSFTAASRLTTLPTSRHPLSLGALNTALRGALAAKRYACAHLLALRFDEDDGGEEGEYWGDVRSVMSLLASAFADASTRLGEALDAVEQARRADEVPSEPTHSRRVSQASSLAPSDTLAPPAPFAPDRLTTLGRRRGRTMQQMVDFAPMPSHLVRFGAHVDAITSALDEAREHLERTVAALRGDDHDHDHDTDTDADADPPSTEDSAAHTASRPHDAPALQAYERLRRELGFALRECERGRERLLDVIAASQPGPSHEDEDASSGEEEDDGVPALAVDAGSEGSSEKASPPPSLGAHSLHLLIAEPAATAMRVIDEDDASAHLLLGADARGLPPPGAELVFEGESGPAVPTRPRSKISREERIRLARERRAEEAVAAPVARRDSGGWGPGGDVVQELKDVIWKVGQRRRRVAEGGREEGEAGAARQSLESEPTES